MKLFSYRDRPVHMGPYPLERLARRDAVPDLEQLPPQAALSFSDPSRPQSLAHAMARFMAMFDVVRDGLCSGAESEIPADPKTRTEHLKAASHYFDAEMVGVCALQPNMMLHAPHRNPMVQELAEELERSEVKSLAAGIDAIVADVKESAAKPLAPIDDHTHALVFLVAFPRDPRADEPGGDWLMGVQTHRAALLSAQTAVLIGTYLRMLGFPARSHTATCSEVDLRRLAVAAGLAVMDEGPDGPQIINPYCGTRFGLAAVTCKLQLLPDQPLKEDPSWAQRWRSHGPAWWLGMGTSKGATQLDPYLNRDFHLGPQPYETLKRRDTPTTFIDHERVPRFPKRADFFARALFGDLGKEVQEASKNGNYVAKSPIGACARRALGALMLLQYGPARGPEMPDTTDPEKNALCIKAAAYFMSTDAVGMCQIPEWAYYSHDAAGKPLDPYHANAVCMLLDQGHETMEGASGDDWIAVAQSMRAYLRFSLLGGVIAEQIRRLGYSARVHSVIDGEVLQPPLLLLSGLGEVSRIGEVILNPFLGPRLKSGVVSTDMPLKSDLPIDFGLQTFCESCNKCARECPSGAISAGPKLMYNGYEIWKTDAEKCTRYRITNAQGAMCGRCMKTCPWNLEGVLAEVAVRKLAMALPRSAPLLTAIDDVLNRGAINPVKKWWWDIEYDASSGRYIQTNRVNARGLNKHIKLKYEDQTLAVYPADRMPAPYPVVQPINRDEGIERYKQLITPTQYRQRLAKGETEGLAPPFQMPSGPPPVLAVVLKKRTEMGEGVAKFEFESVDARPLPPFEAGAHIDVVVAPEYRRSYSLAGDPRNASRYVLGVQKEVAGRGGSALMHRSFREGKLVYITPPANHFPLDPGTQDALLMAGGIGITPMIAMAHQLHREGKRFALHYSAASRAKAGFVQDLREVPWADAVHFHFKDEGARANLSKIIGQHATNRHLYTCGSARYMEGVFEQARTLGWPDDALHREFFSVPEIPDRPMHAFQIRLARTGITVQVPEGKKATEMLIAAGVPVSVKCEEGICGVCAATCLSGEVDHRDLVLSKKDREQKIILCCSRAAHAHQEIVIDV